ncbi:RagB/SusD family nutrient uptake outer membrane protein [Algoriphagus jejuensis]|uniref:RagB/SusD family nutrient uptake outer membrane protein n=1 Tax=Algoriphagus jejuensis TaxID=419934 RepID=A0ABN1MVC8_9BACT
MKNIHIKLITCCLTLGLSGILLSGCQDVLDQEPLSSLSEAAYFKNKEHFVAAANFLHTRTGFEDGDETSDLSNNVTDATERYGRGLNIADPNDEVYKDNYFALRAANQLIDKAAEYAGDPSEIAPSVGTAYFFRAWHHFNLLKKYGGVVIAAKTMDVNSPELTAKRNSRYEVAFQIMNDLDEAIAKLPAASTLGLADQGKLSLEAARSLKARLLLYEGTWEKYVGTAADGDGTSTGAGSAKPAGYPSVTEMLTMAKSEALAVMNSGAFQLWDYKAELGRDHLFYLFNLEDGGSNPAGLSKADNKEYIFQTVYDFNLRRIPNPNSNLTHAKPWGPTRKLMDMYLCADGLPVQHSADFEGYATMTSEFQNRDHRMLTFLPLKKYWGWGNNVDGGGAQYGVAFEDSGIAFDYRHVPNLSSPGTPRNVGYAGRKFITEMKLRETGSESYNYPLIRLAEVMLIYAEATVELNGGTISDADLDLSINKLRTRAGVGRLTNALIAPYPDLTMLGEIRRERAIELFGENFRFDDLKRWNIAPQELNQDITVTVIKGTEWETAENPKNPGKPIYTAGAFELSTEPKSNSSYAGFATVPAGTIVLDRASNRNFSIKHYVDAIPLDEMQLNPNLLQNPGW